MNKHYTVKLLLVFMILWVANASFIHAQTSFAGTIDNDWHNGDNWTAGLPGPGNNANIGGGATPVISQNITVDYEVESYGTIEINALVNNQGVLKNFFGTININSGGGITNLANFDQRGNINIAAGGGFTNSETGSLSTDAGSVIVNNGVMNIGGSFTNLGTITNYGSFVSVGNFLNIRIIENQNDFNINNGVFNNSGQDADLINAPSGTIDINANGTIQNTGAIHNCGTLTNFGEIANNGDIENQLLLNNNNGGTLTNNKNLTNNATMNNNNNATLVNEFEFYNDGEFNNNGLFDNGAYIFNLPAGTFLNSIGGTINNQTGSELSNQNIFSNSGTIQSEGDILNDATFTNENLIYANNNGSIQNDGNFINNNTIQNIGQVTNNSGGTMTNNGTFDILGGTVTNIGDFNNVGRLTNELELVNNQNLYNSGTIENGVRIFNNGYFENSGYLLNIGDFDNNITGNFSNSGAIDNNDGGIITNYGEFNNTNEIFNNPCSSFINETTGILNNHWFTNKSLLWNFGVINGNPIMNMNGGVLITGPTSNAVCESITANLDASGQALILGTSVSVEIFDNCSTLDFQIDGMTEIIFTCADIGVNDVTLTITDRKGNTVDCHAKVTIIDDRSPEIHDCPSEIVVSTTTSSAPVDWIPPTATDNCPPVTLTSTHNPGDIFPLGQTIVTYTAIDTQNNTSICDFPVTVVQDGDCVDIINVRRVTNTHTNCGSSTAYVMWIEGSHYTGKDDLYFVEYRDGTALLTGTTELNGIRGVIYVEFSGYSTSAPSGSPKYNSCVSSGGENWVYYTDFNGTVTLENCEVYHIFRKGPAFQIGIGANIQEANEFGGSGWWKTSGGIDGDFNFRLSEPVDCQRSIILEAECATNIGSKWTVNNDNNASNDQYLLPPGGTSYSSPPVGSEDIVSYEFGVTEAGHYRVYLRSLAADGSSDSYWVRVNGGTWIKWNRVNSPNQGNTYEWDQAGEWTGCNADIPVTFGMNPGTNKIEISWREPNIRLDKLQVTFVGKIPEGEGDVASNCGSQPPVDPPCNTNILFVVGNTNLNNGDLAIKNRLIANGYAVHLVEDDASQTSDADGKGLVIISSTTNSTKVKTKFRDVQVPVLTWEGWIYDDMNMTMGIEGTDYGIHHDNDLDIADPSHPIAAGLSGEIKVYDYNDELNYGKPASSADVIAYVDNDPTRPLIFAYEKGEGMIGMNAPARRIGFFLRDNGADRMTSDGWKLFDAAVEWALDGCDQGGGDPNPCNKTALFVVGSTSLNSGDQLVKSRLESLGFAVTLVNDDNCATSDADGMGIVVISSTVSSSKVNTKYKDVVVPVISWEAWLFDDMKMTSSGSGTNYGSFSSTKRMTIGNPSHPIVQGLSGDIQIFDSNETVNWGNPGSGASRIGYVPGEPNCAMLFAYDRGANMIGINAPDRRVGMFLRNSTPTDLNNTGWLIFDATILWASSCDGSGQNIVVKHQEILNLEAIQDQRRVHLIWKNNTAFKNDLFILERSTDGFHYEVINEFSGYIEENQSLNIYQDLDETPLVGTNFYRVKVQYLDGTFGYSDIQAILFDELSDFALYPNPAGNFVKINLENMQGQDISIRLYDLIGHRIQQININEVSNLDYKMDLSDVKDGQYLVTVYAEGRKPETKKLFIAK